ncbi:hypothetical protein K8T06_03135 [bacterium]|nr:hypothetical protein [bacterium]
MKKYLTRIDIKTVGNRNDVTPLFAAALIEAQGGVILGIATINMDRNCKTAEISRKYQVYTAWIDEK